MGAVWLYTDAPYPIMDISCVGWCLETEKNTPKRNKLVWMHGNIDDIQKNWRHRPFEMEYELNV